MPALNKAYTMGWLATLAYLVTYRGQMERDNLFDGYTGQDYPTCAHKCEGRYLNFRTLDGTCNDLEKPMAGAAGMRFGRNMPGEIITDPKVLLEPNPRVISQTILKREKPIEAKGLNLLVTSWIQFQTHDWVFHDMTDYKNAIEIPLPEGDAMRAQGFTKLRIPRTVPDQPATANKAAWNKNLNTAWWDLSQIYGTTEQANMNIRTGVDGKLKFDDKTGWIPLDPKTGQEYAGFTENWWTGLAMWHNVWTKEHNYLCDQLKKAYPARFDTSKRDPKAVDQELHDLARLAVTAVNAKVHTIEWTEAVLNNKALRTGMHANWYGISGNKDTQDFLRHFPGIRHNSVFTGLVGGKQNNNHVPFSLTEEFASVYRMHSLLPDEIQFRSAKNPSAVSVTNVKDTAFRSHAQIRNKYSFSDLLYTFGRQAPTALTVRNFPNFLQNLNKPGDPETIMDIATRDIVRERERGVKRYNAFRRHMGLKPVKDFDHLTTDKSVVEELKRLYNNDIEKLDLLVGCLAENPRPKNFGFGETAFAIFILMASRRLKTDRFLNEYYNKEVYTEVGYEYTVKNGMREILARQFPELADKFKDTQFVFQEWKE